MLFTVSALLSFFIGLFGVLFVDFRAVLENGFFQGYTPIVLLVITLQVSTAQEHISRYMQNLMYMYM